MNRVGRGSNRGFTLVEVTVVASVMSVLALLIVQALADLSRAQSFTRGQARTAEAADRVMRGLVRDLTFSVRVFADGEQADGYLGALDHPASLIVPGARLPTLTDTGLFEPDAAGVLETGNMILVGRYQSPAIVTVPDHSSGGASGGSGTMLLEGGGGGSSASTRDLRIDTMSFVLYYLRSSEGGVLDLARWGSVPVARFEDLMIVDFEDRASALAQLYSSGVHYVWDTALDAEDGLYRVSAAGTMVLIGSAKIPPDPAQTQTSIVGFKQMRVARNGRVGKVTVPKYAEAAPTGFPGGFEIKVDGPSAGKLVLVRLALRMGPGETTDNFAEILRFVSCRDG